MIRTRRITASIALALLIAGLAALPAHAIDAAIDIIDFAFQPDQRVVGLNGTVMWTNRGLAPHTVTFEDGSGDSGVLNRGQSYSQTFSAPGTYSYFCMIHETMRGSITVLDVPLEPHVWIPLVVNESSIDSSGVE